MSIRARIGPEMRFCYLVTTAGAYVQGFLCIIEISVWAGVYTITSPASTQKEKLAEGLLMVTDKRTPK
jgi:hypothetical protein